MLGFAIGNGGTGEMWVIALLPEAEGRGIGARLLGRVEAWLWSLGWDRIWLTTDLDRGLRADGFYRRQGWTELRIEEGQRVLGKRRPEPPG